MNKLLIALFCVFSLFLLSCNREDGDCEGVGLSKNEVNFTAASNSVTLTTKSRNWWLSEIFLDGTKIDFTAEETSSNNYIITKSDFEINRKDEKTIVITMNKNSTNKERVLKLILQNGNCFDGVSVKQSQ